VGRLDGIGKSLDAVTSSWYFCCFCCL
jgi:hypothetical protein